MLIRLAYKMTTDSIVDGPGLRAVIWTQGCKHHCKDCHNPTTHDFNGGFLMDTQDIASELESLRLNRGITFSGGDPFEQPLECLELAKKAKELGLDIWCYTGYTFEELMNTKGNRYKEGWLEFLKSIDVLIDGPFILEKKNLLLRFRGSENQRILDVQRSLKLKMPVLYKDYYEIHIEQTAMAR
ncbi:MAG: anaerobic ribonucleoside-triphosphate reductase activating protein [Thermotaleaceae bacterium]